MSEAIHASCIHIAAMDDETGESLEITLPIKLHSNKYLLSLTGPNEYGEKQEIVYFTEATKKMVEAEAAKEKATGMVDMDEFRPKPGDES